MSFFFNEICTWVVPLVTSHLWSISLSYVLNINSCLCSLLARGTLHSRCVLDNQNSLYGVFFIGLGNGFLMINRVHNNYTATQLRLHFKTTSKFSSSKATSGVFFISSNLRLLWRGVYLSQLFLAFHFHDFTWPLVGIEDVEADYLSWTEAFSSRRATLHSNCSQFTLLRQIMLQFHLIIY